MIQRHHRLQRIEKQYQTHTNTYYQQCSSWSKWHNDNQLTGIYHV